MSPDNNVETEKLAESNGETVKSMYEAFAEGDIEAMTATWAPDIEFTEAEGLVGGGTYHGAEEIVEDVFATMANEWEEVSVVPGRMIEDGDTVVVFYTWSGTYTETGKSAEFPGIHVLEFDDGKISQWRSYGDTALFNAAMEE
jgi:steroid delta-isomerase-like uncharacterized protein